MNMKALVAAVTACAMVGSTMAAPPAAPPEMAKLLLKEAGVQGGLVVHVGCGDGTLTAALGAGESYIVQGLDTDPANVEKARSTIHRGKLDGKVTAELFDGKRLPYVDNLVNLVIADDLGNVPMEEVMRVLCPGGVAYLKKGGKTVKPRPAEIDEWTHYMHDATNNAVASDSVVGPPRHYQWVGSPAWARHHDHTSSMPAMVSANGRVFYIFDEGPDDSIQLPSKWTLIARDAFNGTILWNRPMVDWTPAMFPFKSGPAQPPRRLVAVGDRVYVTLGLTEPLVELDAATGLTIRTYENSKATEEVIASDGVLFMLVNESPVDWSAYKQTTNQISFEKGFVAKDFAWNEKPRQVTAVEALTGKQLWRKEYKVAPLTLTADAECVYFHDGERIICLSRKDGSELWKSEPVESRPMIMVFFGSTLVAYKDVVLFSGGTKNMVALSAKTGKELWSAPHPAAGHSSPEDVLVVNDLVWSGAIALGKDSGVFTGRDLHTGEAKVEFPPDVKTFWFHHRCHRAKATEKYLIPSRTGVEFVDVKEKSWTVNPWVRGACAYGVMPANGLLYAPQHPCACYIESKLNGLCALAPESGGRKIGEVSDEGRLQQGPAFGRKHDNLPAGSVADWPTFRHDAARSGVSQADLPAKLENLWQSDLGGKLTAPVVAGGKVLLADVDAHIVYALDEKSGKQAWSFTAGGRVDSPPTYFDGKVIFGSADGHVYCLDADDGALVWRFRAAPQDRQMTYYEQLESVWPVHGSVLVQDGVVHTIAGRSMFLDGGMRYVRLDARTGRKMSETVLDDRDPQTGKDLLAKVNNLNMPVAASDILSSDGKNVFLRSQAFDMEGKQRDILPSGIARPDSEPQKQTPHLFSPSGFLDDSWFHRQYWVYGIGFDSGAGGWPRAGHIEPAGGLLVVNDAAVFGFGKKPKYYNWTTPVDYQLFASTKQFATTLPTSGWGQPDANAPAKIQTASAPDTAVVYNWTQDVPMLVRAMVLTGKTLVIAGPPKLIDENETFDKQGAPETVAKLKEQAAALKGEKGAILWAVSAGDGKKVLESKIDSVPVFDGMISANGRLVIVTRDGKVTCLGTK